MLGLAKPKQHQLNITILCRDAEMLSINRHLGESIIIDGCIEVTVNKIQKLNGDGRVELGITAPRKISIHRKEIQDAINREKELSAAGLVS